MRHRSPSVYGRLVVNSTSHQVHVDKSSIGLDRWSLLTNVYPIKQDLARSNFLTFDKQTCVFFYNRGQNIKRRVSTSGNHSILMSQCQPRHFLTSACFTSRLGTLWAEPPGGGSFKGGWIKDVTTVTVGLNIGGISAIGDEKEIKEANCRYTFLRVSRSSVHSGNRQPQC